ncbi:hypothetical protein DKX38_015868 [Salix brachista]|uniref:Secreted protein n=1 Tax=Salix brachista TaxID=2182728 RepID=A0A5N5L6F4_9ROSI|nr:hypothetical protein DKX38_015868 [Salix brachista]
MLVLAGFAWGMQCSLSAAASRAVSAWMIGFPWAAFLCSRSGLSRSNVWGLSKMRLVDEPMACHNQGASTTLCTYSTRSIAGQLASWKTFSGLLIIVLGSEVVNILIEETLDFVVVPSKEMGPDNNGRLK